MKNKIKTNLSLKITFAFLVGSTASTALGAEGTFGGFGVHGGLNFSDYQYSNSLINQTKKGSTGYMAGVHLQGITLGLFGLRFEANYSVKGYELSQFATVTHRYLQVPLLFKISPIVGPVELFVEAGPAVAIHLNSTTEVANSSITFNDDSNNLDFSAIVGAGIGFKVEPVLVELELRYDYGLTNLSDSSAIDVKSRAFQVIAGITFLI